MNEIEVVHLKETCRNCLGTATVQKFIIVRNFNGEIVERVPGLKDCLDCRGMRK